MIPDSVLSTWVFQRLGTSIHKAHIRWQDRVQGLQVTFFLRNLPLLENLRALALKLPAEAAWRVVSVGCSTGAELYSLLWYIRSARPDLQIVATGIDIAEEAVAKAIEAKYFVGDAELSLLSTPVIEAIFDQAGDTFRVKDWVRKDIRWLAADATDPYLFEHIGSADLLLANNLVGAMPDAQAEKVMTNLLRLVAPGGYFVLNGNLDLKARFAKRYGLQPLCEGIEAIHFGDPTKVAWPWYYSAPEPIERRHPEWQIRYAQVFRKPF